MKRDSLALVVGLAGLVVALFALFRPAPMSTSAPPPAAAPTPSASRDLLPSAITLDGTTTADCKVTFKTPRTHGSRGGDVAWLIFNPCGKGQVVEFKDFMYNGQPVDDPIDVKTATVNGLFGSLKAKVKSSANMGTYTFTVYLNGKPQPDPEIVIEG